MVAHSAPVVDVVHFPLYSQHEHDHHAIELPHHADAFHSEGGHFGNEGMSFPYKRRKLAAKAYKNRKLAAKALKKRKLAAKKTLRKHRKRHAKGN